MKLVNFVGLVACVMMAACNPFGGKKSDQADQPAATEQAETAAEGEASAASN